jgi:hypothetical protein
MLSKISLLTTHIFAVLYPLCFLISAKDPLKKNFHKFHLGLPAILAGILLFIITLGNLPTEIKLLTAVWSISLLLLTAFYWNKEYPKPFLIMFPFIFGMINFVQLQAFYISPDWKIVAAGILAGAVFTGSMYSMNLGHFYLNVHGLPVKHLIWATNVFLWTLITRLIWDLVLLIQTSVMYKGETIPVWKFISTLDGIFLLIGIFFGTVFPLCSLYFAYGTLKLKNTQATTGILYVILSAVCLGDLTYKFYLIRYGIPL